MRGPLGQYPRARSKHFFGNKFLPAGREPDFPRTGGGRRFEASTLNMTGSSRDQWRRRRGYHHGNLKEVLLEAARQLIAQRGPEGFSLTP